jgi:hypothetical protein
LKSILLMVKPKRKLKLIDTEFGETEIDVAEFHDENPSIDNRLVECILFTM